ncbi:alpha/beta hydrolase [Ruegeria sp.]|uniref:alpha/beta fold hydrolase n=1 Tax=Ruegeria sp. TaxID=1879320 RepID=UPI002315997B|nr:alpha/beta hydrolase [Ruegeria sp.]MDA7967211.1 alpha/beta hydrolase [Ruegeria sp.]
MEGEDTAGIAQWAKEIALDQSPEALTRGLDAFYTRSSCEHLVMESTIPIHVVTGDRDELPGLSYSRRLAELSVNARLHVIKDCGHYVPMMQPMALNNLIADVVGDADINCVF